MTYKKLMLTVIVSVVILACLYEDVQARRKATTPQSHQGLEFIMEMMKNSTNPQPSPSDSGDIWYNPVRILLSTIWLVLKIVTYAPRLVYRMIFSFMVTFGLLMLGCRIIPVVRCFNPDVDVAVQEFLRVFHENF